MNLRSFDDYKKTYDLMINGKGYFSFWIECYHHRTTRDSKGRTRRRNLVTHKMIVEALTGIKEIARYVFVNYIKKFYFADDVSAKNYNDSYRSFIGRKKRDRHQSYSTPFCIDGFSEEVGFCAMGETSHSSVVYYFTSVFGVALIYACILEKSVSQINIVKRLT